MIHEKFGMMKKITTTLLAMLLTMMVANLHPLTAQTLFHEGFDGGVLPAGWAVVDADGDGYTWLSSIFLMGSNYGYNGSAGCFCSQSYDYSAGALAPDNWLVSPAISLNSNVTLSFWVCAQDANYAEEHYGVYISTNGGTSTSDFTLLYEETMDSNGGAKVQGAWKQKSVDLSAYTGQTVRIAFRHFNCSDMFYLNLDDVEIFAQPTNPTIVAQPNTIDFGTLAIGGSQAQSVTVTTYNLTADVMASANAPYFVSADGVTFETTVTVAATGGTLYVKYVPTTVSIDNGIVILTSTGATDVAISLTGEAIDCNATIPYNYAFDNDVQAQCWNIIDANNDGHAFAIDAANGHAYYHYNYLNGADDWLISPVFTLNGTQIASVDYFVKNSEYPEKFQVLAIGSDTLELTPVITASNTTVETKYLNLQGLVGDYRVAIHCVSDADELDLYIDNFSLYSFDGIIVSPDTIDFGYQTMNIASLPQQVDVIGGSLPNNITVVISEQFEVSADGVSFADTITLPEVGGALYVRFIPSAVGIQTGVITFICDTLSRTIAVSGFGIGNYSQIVYVTPTGAGNHSGNSWANAISSLDSAQTLAQIYGSVVWVAAGTYYGDTLSENAFTMVEGINVYGGFAGNEPADYSLSMRNFEENTTFLDGQNARRVLNQPSQFNSTTTWDGFTIKNGMSSNGGGAYLYNNGMLSHCIITHNSAYCGGGVYSYQNPTISNCLISNNTASYGGGVYKATVNNSTIVRNIANYGAGVYGSSGGSITNCIVWGNGTNVTNNIAGNITCSYSAIEGGYEGEENIILSEYIQQSPRFISPSLTSGISDSTTNVNWHLQSGSPCINRGNNEFVNDSVDLDGLMRIQRDTVDLGCFESNYLSSPIINPNYNGIIYVTQEGAGSHTGEDWENATSSIDTAQSIALFNNAVVWVAAGTYYGDTLSDNAFVMKPGVNVYGGFAGDEPADYDLSLRNFEANATVLDGRHERRVLQYYQPYSNILTTWDGFTIQNGNNSGVSLYGRGNINHCIVKNNSAYSGGGIRISNNSIVSNSVISYNISSYDGGGVYADNSTIINCLITNNEAYHAGGGVFNYNATITNSTIVRNLASYGAGTFGEYNGSVTNSIVWGNGSIVTNNVFGDISCSFSAIEGGYEGDNIIILSDINQPLFVHPSLSSGVSDSTTSLDWHLQQESVCINRGNNELVLDSLDLDGNYRIQKDTVDLGCYESNHHSIPINTPNYHGIVFVTQNGSGTQTGEDWTNATSSLSFASVMAKNYHVDIWVASGIYYGDTSAANAFTMIDGVNVYGGFAGNEPDDYDLSQRDFETNTTILDGNNARRVLYQPYVFNDSTTTWDGFTIRNGHCFTEDYYKRHGGGVYLYNGILRRCIIKNNHAERYGGGVYICSDGKLLECDVSHNYSSYGGGIYVEFYRSTSGSIVYPSVKIINSLISNNDGGGVCSYYGELSILNSTIVRNSNSGMSDDSYNYGVSSSNNALCELKNCIVWGNRGHYGLKNLSSGIACSYSAVDGGYEGDNNITLSALTPSLFIKPSITAGASDMTENVDWHLQQESPCVNRGNNTVVMDSVDLDGAVRIKRDTVDMGCFESDFYSSPIIEPNYSNVIYVTQEGSGSRTGESWDNATSSLSSALEVAKTNHAVVWVAAGTYYGDTTANSENAFTMIDGVNVYGGFAGDEPADYDLSLRDFETNATILDGQNARRVLNQPSVFNTHTSWDGFTIQHGRVDDNGAGVWIRGNTTLSNCFVRENTIFCPTYSYYYYRYGAGIYAYGNSTINSCIISNNHFENVYSGYGGGVYASNANISHSKIIHNMATYYGGGLYVSGYSVVKNCLVANNEALYRGGGIYIANSNINILNSTIVRNLAETGRGIYSLTGGNMSNSIVWGNGTDETKNIYGTITSSYSAIEGNAVGDNNVVLSDLIQQMPHFVNPSVTSGSSDTTSNVDWHLQLGSACINKGLNDLVTDSLDLDGHQRIQHDTVDIGCYESGHNGSDVIYSGGIIYVTESGAGNRSGYSWDNAMLSILDAQILASEINAQVWVAAGTYYGDTSASNAFTMRNGVSVYGGFAGNEPADYDLALRDLVANATILDGQQSRRVLYQPASFTRKTIWDGFTIQNGNTSGNGSGAYLQLNGCLNRCVIQRNISYGYGGGVYANNSHLENCSVSLNAAYYNGGGAYLNYSTLSKCRIFTNAALSRGGGLIMNNAKVENSLVSNNTSSVGGGVYAFGEKDTIINSTVVHNMSYDAGGIKGDNRTYMSNCIVWGNEAENADSNISDDVVCSHCAIGGGHQGDMILVLNDIDNPGFVSPSATAGVFDSTIVVDWHLLQSSPCINRGNNLAITDSLDLDGTARIKRDTVDLGCYESNYYRVPDTLCVTYYHDIFDSICDSYDWYDYHGISQSGDYTHTFTTVLGCDSVVTLHLIVYHSYIYDTTVVACDSIDWYEYLNITQSGDYIHTSSTASGCDSVLTLHLTLNHTSYGDTAAVVCNHFDWYEFINITESGDYLHVFTNAEGCDSVVTLHLTVNYSNTGDTAAVACDTYDWYEHTNISQSGDYVHTFTNSAGCDSVVTLHLTINHSSTSDTFAVVCNRFDWYEYQNITQSGEYTHTLTNAAGCDSILTLHLTVNHTTYGDTTAVVCDLFDWHENTYTHTGDYPYYLSNSESCDSIVTLHLTVNHSVTTNEYLSICESDLPYSYRDTVFELGTPQLSIINYQFSTTNGCDSIVTLHLNVLPSMVGEFMAMTPTNNYPITNYPMHFTWDAVENASDYDLYVWPVGESQPQEPTVAQIHGTQYTMANLPNHLEYQWFMKAYNACDTSTSTVRQFSLNVTPALTVTADNPIDFGEVPLNSTRNVYFQVHGTALDSVITYQISGADASSFDLSPASSWDSLAGGGMQLTFHPTMPQNEYTAQMTFQSDSLVKTITVKGYLSDYLTFTTYVDTNVYAMDSEIPIHGRVTNPLNEPVAGLEVEVYVSVMDYVRTLPAASDANGQFTVMFTPQHSEAGYYTVGSRRAGGNSTAVHDDFNIPGMMLVSSDWILWEPTIDQPDTGVIAVRNRSQISLTNIQVTPLSLPNGCTVQFVPLNLAGMATGNLQYIISGSEISTGVNYEEVRLNAVSSEGAAMSFSAWYYCIPQRADLDVTPTSLITTMTRGKSKVVDFKIYNNGTGPTGNIYISLPDVSWMSVVGSDTLPSLAVHDSAYVSIRLSADSTTDLVRYTGNFAINCERGEGISIPYNITAISDSTGTLVVDVTDEYTWNTNNGHGPHLAGANVIVRGYYSLETVATGVTDANGHFVVNDLPEGYYKLIVRADRHAEYQGVLLITAGDTNRQDIFIQFQAITYSWEVVPTEIEDEYTYDLNVVFETHVPKPVVVVEISRKIPELEPGESIIFDLIITNYGLITANDVEVFLPTIQNHTLTPLISMMDSIPALSTIIIPVEVRHNEIVNESVSKYYYDGMELDDGSGDPCLKIIGVKFSYICGPDKQWHFSASKSLWEINSCMAVAISELLPVGSFSPPHKDKDGDGHEHTNDEVDNPPATHAEISCEQCDELLIGMVSECCPIIGNVVDAVEDPNWTVDNIVDNYVENKIIGLLKSKAIEILEIGSPVVRFVIDYFDCFKEGAKYLGCKFGDYVGSKNIELTQKSSTNVVGQQEVESVLIIGDFFTVQAEIIKYIISDELFDLYEDATRLLDCSGTIIDSLHYFRVEDVDSLVQCMSNSNIPEIQIRNFAHRWNVYIDNIDANSSLLSTDTSIFFITDTSLLTLSPIDIMYVDSLLSKMYSLLLTIDSKGYNTISDMYYEAKSSLDSIIAGMSATSVCASVTVQFSQTMTMTREAFEGTLTINNGHESVPMQDIDVDFVIRDENGVDCTNLFQVNFLSYNNMTGTNGSLVLDAQNEGSIIVQFIPTKQAAPEIAKVYSFGGSFSFIDPFTGEFMTYNLYPVDIWVNPSPDLYVNYFMQRDILGDDPLTEDRIEPIVPAELGVIIHNRGAGTAKNVLLETAEPRIIDNEKGLAIDFAMYGAAFNGNERQLGLMEIPFGNIEPNHTGVGEWWFTSTLLGHFVSYEAHVIHNNSFGNPDLSLVSSLDIHPLIHTVYAYGNLDDGINDFLVDDVEDILNYPDSLYFSNGSRTGVATADSIGFDHYVTPMDTIVILTLDPSRIGWNYEQTWDPGRGQYKLISCTRNSDQQVIPLSNVWQSFVTLPVGADPIYENRLHIVDTLSNDLPTTYTLVFSLKEQILEVDTILNVPESFITEPLGDVTVKFNKPIVDSTFNYLDMSLKCNNGANLIDENLNVEKLDSVTYKLHLNGYTQQSGYYVLNIQTLNITDVYGFNGYYGKQATWIQVITTCQPDSVSIADTACNSYTWGGVTYTQSGDYLHTFANSAGCDSVVTLHLTINHSVSELVEATACDSYTWNDSVYTQSGTYTQTFTAANGCDSVVTLHLTLKYSETAEYAETACDSYTWNDSVYAQSGDYVQTFTNADGCDSIITLHLTVNYSNTGDTTAIACDSLNWYGTTYMSSGDYSYTLTNAAGCDSIVTLHLTVNYSNTGDTTAIACDSFEWYGTTYTSSGDYLHTLTNANGCDSIVTLHLTVNYSNTGDTTAIVCDSYEWYGTTYTSSGNYPHTLTNVSGCDSVVTLHLTVNYSNTGDTTVIACDSFDWYGTSYTTSGNYTRTLTNVAGCDSVVTLHLTVNYSNTGDTNAVACDSFYWHGTTYTSSGDYPYTLTNANGCDSVVTLHLTVNYSNTGDTTAIACDSFDWYGTTYTSSGDYPYTLTNANGCDSIVTLHLTVNYSNTGDTTAIVCDSYEWYGTTYTSSGNYPHTLTNVSGCDSLVTLHLTVNYSNTGDTTAIACDSFDWYEHTNLTQSGEYMHIFTNTTGCDSVVTLHLTVYHPVAELVEVTACESYEWNGMTYTQSGTYTYSHLDANGCTQVDTLLLTVYHPVAEVVGATACESFSWNGTTYTQSGTYTYSHFDANGCTQVDTLHLTVNHPVAEVVEVTACENYTWNGTTYTQSGTYTYSHLDANGCTQVDTLLLTVYHPVAELVEVTACENYSWNGTIYTQSGTYTYSHPDANGCTQVDTLHLTVNYPVAELVEVTACESYMWNGTTYTQSGTYTYSHLDANGCTQVDTLHLTVNYPGTEVVEATACDSYTWNGTTYTQSGDYMQTFIAANGCDSVVTLHLTLIEIPVLQDITGEPEICINQYATYHYDISDPNYQYRWLKDNVLWAENVPVLTLHEMGESIVAVTMQVADGQTGCAADTSLYVQVLNRIAPDTTEIRRKVNTNILICQPVYSDYGQVHYRWGYTDLNTTAEVIVPGDRNYCLYDFGIDTLSYRYWVETYLNEAVGVGCENRSYYAYGYITTSTPDYGGNVVEAYLSNDRIVLYVNSLSLENIMTSLYDVNGKLLLSKGYGTTDQVSDVIPVSIAPGVYFLRVSIGGQMYSVKLLKI